MTGQGKEGKIKFAALDQPKFSALDKATMTSLLPTYTLSHLFFHMAPISDYNINGIDVIWIYQIDKRSIFSRYSTWLNLLFSMIFILHILFAFGNSLELKDKVIVLIHSPQSIFKGSGFIILFIIFQKQTIIGRQVVWVHPRVSLSSL